MNQLFETVSPNEYPERDGNDNFYSIPVPAYNQDGNATIASYSFCHAKWTDHLTDNFITILYWFRPAPQGKYKEVEKEPDKLPGFKKFGNFKGGIKSTHP